MLRSRRKDGALPNFKPWQEKSGPPSLAKRREGLAGRELLYLLTSLHPNLKKNKESSLLVTMDKVPSSSVTTYKFSTLSSARRELTPM